MYSVILKVNAGLRQRVTLMFKIMYIKIELT